MYFYLLSWLPTGFVKYPVSEELNFPLLGPFMGHWQNSPGVAEF